MTILDLRFGGEWFISKELSPKPTAEPAPDNPGWTTFTAADGLTGRGTLSIWGGKEDNLWIGTSFGGLNYFEEGQWKSFTEDNSDIGGNTIFKVWGDSAGTIWVSVGEVRKAQSGSISNI